MSAPPCITFSILFYLGLNTFKFNPISFLFVICDKCQSPLKYGKFGHSLRHTIFYLHQHFPYFLAFAFASHYSYFLTLMLTQSKNFFSRFFRPNQSCLLSNQSFGKTLTSTAAWSHAGVVCELIITL